MGICNSSCCGGAILPPFHSSPGRADGANLVVCLISGRDRDGLYEPVLADSEREAVADLLQYLENVRVT